MKKVITLLFLLVASQIFARTNSYTNGFGIRLGKFNSGISFKHFLVEEVSGLQLEGHITHMADGGFTGKAFYFRQIPFKVPIVQLPLDLIYGGGVHLGYFPKEDYGYYRIEHGDAVYYGENVFSGGIDGTIQVEYQVSRKIAPVTITIDCVPFFEFYNEGPEHIDFGVSLRYIIR